MEFPTGQQPGDVVEEKRMPKTACAYLGDIVAAQHQTAASTVLLHGTSETVLGLGAESVNFIQHQHFETLLTLHVNRPALGHVLLASCK